MSLIFFKNNKPDNRMIEYDQAVVRLGLEKAELEREVEKKRKEVRGISIAIDLVKVAFFKDRKELTDEKMKEIEGQSSTLLDFKERTADEKKKLDDLVLKQKQVLGEIENKEKERDEIGLSIDAYNESNSSLVKSSELLAEEKKQKEREKGIVLSSLHTVLKDKNKAASDLQEMNIKKNESEHALEKANKDLAELNEIISILQATNKQGLDLVASFEGERKRLQEKEESLRRKEDDLIIYENRIKKAAEKTGYNVKMIFK